MSGFLTPDARLRVLSDLSVVLGGAKLHTYVAGSPSTPLATYTNVALSVANANPVVADAGGLFPPIYLTPGLSYKLVLTDAADVPVWSQDDIAVPSADGSTLKAADGTVLLPGVTFNSDLDSGSYREGANAIAWATGGVKALGIDSTQCIDSPTQPRCVAYHNTTQSLLSGARTALLLNSEDVDVGTMHDLVTNNSRITVPAGGDGFYLVIGQAGFAASGAGTFREVDIQKNGATLLATTLMAAAVGASFANINVMWAGVLAAGDYLELMGVQDTGGALNLGNATRSNTNALAVVKLW